LTDVDALPPSRPAILAFGVKRVDVDRAIPVIHRRPSGAIGRTLARWRALFADELRQIRDTRNAAAHGRISDVELRTAVYLAWRLLAAAYGRSLHELDPV
jgi:hypothetical protein